MGLTKIIFEVIRVADNGKNRVLELNYNANASVAVWQQNKAEFVSKYKEHVIGTETSCSCIEVSIIRVNERGNRQLTIVYFPQNKSRLEKLRASGVRVVSYTEHITNFGRLPLEYVVDMVSEQNVGFREYNQKLLMGVNVLLGDAFGNLV